MPWDLYAVLEVAKDATDEDIRRAYFTLVRKYPPQEDPEGFKKLRQAYDILGDPFKRGEYDAAQKHSKELTRLLKQAQEAVAKENWGEAAGYYKLVVGLNPYDLHSLNELGWCYLNDENYRRAIDTFLKLTQLEEDNPFAWQSLGLAYSWGTTRNKNTVADYKPRSIAAFKKALELAPKNREIYINIGDVLLYFEEYAQARKYLKQGLENCGDDPQLIVLLVRASINLNNKAELSNCEAIIDRYVKAQSENKRPLAGFLVDRGLDRLTCFEHEEARWLIKQGYSLAPENWDQDISSWVDSLADVMAGMFQVKNRISKPLADLIELLVTREITSDDDLSPKDYREYANLLLDTLYNNHSPAGIIANLDLLEREFPQVYKFGETVFVAIRSDCRQATGSKSQNYSQPVIPTTPQTAASTQKSGEGWLVGGIIGGVIGAAGGPIGIAVGAWLGHKIGKFIDEN